MQKPNMKFKITGLLLCLAGAGIVFWFPLPGNLIGIPIFAVGAIIVVALSDGQNWRNLQ